MRRSFRMTVRHIRAGPQGKPGAASTADARTIEITQTRRGRSIPDD